MPTRKKSNVFFSEIRDKEAFWASKAKLAVDKGKDNLARQALQEKRRYTQKSDAAEAESAEIEAIIEQYRVDIRELEDKLKTAREKQRILVQRHIRAKSKKKTREEIRRADSQDILYKFEEMENHIEQMEAEADLVDYGRPSNLEEQFDALEADEDIEAELNRLKSLQSPKGHDTTNE